MRPWRQQEEADPAAFDRDCEAGGNCAPMWISASDAASNANVLVPADSTCSTPPEQPQSDMEEAYPLLLAASAMVSPIPLPSFASSRHLGLYCGKAQCVTNSGIQGFHFSLLRVSPFYFWPIAIPSSPRFFPGAT